METIGFENVLAACYTDNTNITGTTTFIFPEGAKGAAVTMGGGTSTRGFDPLMPERNSTPVFAFSITGGSAMGLDSNLGVSRFLRESGLGLKIDHLKNTYHGQRCYF